MKKIIGVFIVLLMSFNGISAQEECDTPIAVLMAERIDGMNEVQQEYCVLKWNSWLLPKEFHPISFILSSFLRQMS